MTRIIKTMRLPAIVFAWVALLAATTPLYAQSRYQVPATLDGTASGRLMQASNGNFYGVTYIGGDGFGTIFRLTPDGVLTTIAHFSPEMGAPAVGSGLLQASDGDLYGTTEGGATFGGTIFRYSLSDGTLSTWAAFDLATHGSTPSGRLIEGKDGYLYGTALFGAEDETGVSAPGLVFRVNRAKATTDAAGTIETVVEFPLDASAGEAPSAGLVQAADGSFYGTA